VNELVNPTATSPTEILLLTKRWVGEMGKRSRFVELQDRDGLRGAVLVVDHLGWKVFIQERSRCILVMVIVDIPRALVEKVSSMPEPIQSRLECNLRIELTSNARTAYTLRPSQAQHLSSLRRMTVEQLIRVSGDDPSSFNRLVDAIQEVVTTATRASSVLTPFLPKDDEESAGLSEDDAPLGMYV